MRKHIVFALLLVVSGTVVCGTTAHAQCTVDTSGYAVYDSEAPSNNFTDTTGVMLATIGVDGTAGMSGTCGDLTFVTHTPSLLSNWGSHTGDSVCASCYLSTQITVDSGPVPFGTEYTFSYEGDVTCSAVGLAFSVSNEKFLSLHRTTYKYASIQEGICTYNVNCITSPHICGPDSVTVQAPCQQTYFITVWLKVRVGIYSTCFPIPGPQSGVLSFQWLACN